ncbi:MAG: molybdopterin molybdotransferase MoeA [Anaeromicrobium sp.]|jgi:molybdopterin molybdotransferase|uniref:molybdopterin molybdotransferase MoeA n=1 Tax=Anaeromicrobium sp. TaxID=1929132 RepID=UPI0025DCE48B|nr:gephyrin-like molybdotransferase Glp [Anaeromicrobium sp.]MCT4593298.1 molybdopterin molybdotransferase MoeA [Anaeromicrobium sp.]
MIKLEKAQSIINEYIKTLDKEIISLIDSHERVLGEDIYAPINQPPFNRSPLDGYALRGEDSKGATKDSPITLNVIDEICAGEYTKKIVKKGQAIRIMTGAPIPEGANCVIRQEDTNEGKDLVNIYKELKPFSNYCYEGEDVKRGTLIIKKGSFLNHIKIGILASLGIDKVKVYKRPKVGLLTTGDELIELGQSLPTGKIYNSNLYTLSMRLKELYTEPIVLNMGKDCEKEMEEEIKKSLDKVDFLITTGGASVGKKDLIKSVLEKMGANILFWKIDIKPGTPVLCSELDKKLIISLSGNPAAASITFEVLVRDYISKLTNINHICLNRKKAYFNDEFNKGSMRRRFLRGICTETKEKTLVDLSNKTQSSGVLSSSLNCNCLIDIPSGTKSLKKGEEVEIILL